MKFTNVKRHGLVVLFYVLLALVMTWPLASNFGSHIAGSGGDPWQTLWRFEEKADLLSHPDELFSELTGGGVPRLVNLSVWPWMLGHLVLGQPVTYNLTFLLSFVLAGYGVYLLIGYLSVKTQNSEALPRAGLMADLVQEAPAVLAGVFYMFLPYHVAQAQGHFGAMQIQWLPFVVLAMLMWFRGPTLIRTLLVVLAVTLQAWSEHHYALWAMLFVLIYIVWHRGGHQWWKTWSEKLQIALLIVLLIALVVVPYWPTIRLGFANDSPLNLGSEQVIRFSADIFSFVVPSGAHPIWGSLSYTLFGQNFTGNSAEAIQYMGLVPLLLVIFFYRQISNKEKKFWLTIGAVFLVIALGPRLHVLGRVLPVPLPYAGLDNLPVFGAVRVVGRSGIMVGLALAVLLGWIFKDQLRRPISVMIILLALLIEFLFIPIPLQSVQLPAVYAALGNEGGRSVVEIPAATNYTTASRALLAARDHGKTVIGNIALERALDASVFDEVRSLPALRQLLYLRTTHLLEDRDEFFGQDLGETLPDVLKWLDVQTVVVHPDSLSVIQLASVQQLLDVRLALVPEVIGDALLYRIDPRSDSDGVFLSRDGGWENVGYDAERDSVFGEVSDIAMITLYNVRSSDVTVQLNWEVPDESAGNLLIDTTARWQDDWRPIKKVRTVQVSLMPGKTELHFTHAGAGKSIIQNPRMQIL